MWDSPSSLLSGLLQDIYGAVQATAVSSGFCLGSSNWVIKSAHEKIAYVSGSSTLTTHPRPINQAALRGADLLLLAALTQTPAHNPDNMLGDLCMHAGKCDSTRHSTLTVGAQPQRIMISTCFTHTAMTLRGGGSVLVPCYPSGVVYDLLECLSGHLENAGLAQVPLYFISPVADSSLAYSNILAEWLSGGKQARVYLPEEPFPHAQLVRGGRLRHYPSLHHDAFSADFRQVPSLFRSLQFAGDNTDMIGSHRSRPTSDNPRNPSQNSNFSCSQCNVLNVCE